MNNEKDNLSKFSIKRFVLYGVFPSLIVNLIFITLPTIYLTKVLSNKLDELENRLEAIEVNINDLSSSKEGATLYTLKQEIDKDVDEKLERLDEKIDSAFDSINHRIDNLYINLH